MKMQIRPPWAQPPRPPVEVGIHPPLLLATNHVVGFSRLSWLSHDVMIQGEGRGVRRPATLRASPSARPTWLSAVRYDRATGPMVIDWLGSG